MGIVELVASAVVTMRRALAAGARRMFDRQALAVASIEASANRWTGYDWTTDLRTYRHGTTDVRYLDHGTGPTMVLLHGMGCCWQWWLECVPELARVHRILAIDTPGFGDSDRLPAPVSMADYADVVAGVMRHAEAPAGVVVGHSMGGLIAIEVAERHPQLVERLVLVDSGGVPMSEERLRVVLAVLRGAMRAFANPVMLSLMVRSRFARRVLLRGAMRDPGTMSDELAAVVVPKLGAPGFAEAITASAAAVRASEPESIVQPTHLIWGERDPFAPLRTAEDMLARLPDGRLDVLPGLGHTPLVEAPTELCRLLLMPHPDSASSGTERNAS